MFSKEFQKLSYLILSLYKPNQKCALSSTLEGITHNYVGIASGMVPFLSPTHKGPIGQVWAYSMTNRKLSEVRPRRALYTSTLEWRPEWFRSSVQGIKFQFDKFGPILNQFESLSEVRPTSA